MVAKQRSPRGDLQSPKWLKMEIKIGKFLLPTEDGWLQDDGWEDSATGDWEGPPG